jgi:hypothetical protein
MPSADGGISWELDRVGPRALTPPVHGTLPWGMREGVPGHGTSVRPSGRASGVGFRSQ